MTESEGVEGEEENSNLDEAWSDVAAAIECPECGAKRVPGWVHATTYLSHVEAWSDGVVLIPVETFQLPESVTIEIRCTCGWSVQANEWEQG